MLHLPLTSVIEEFKVTKVRQAMTIRDNRDEKVCKAGVKLSTGQKWQVHEALEEAESRLSHSDIVGTVTRGRLGLGCITRSQWRKATNDQRKGVVQAEKGNQEEEARKTKAVSQRTQGNWTRWQSIRSKKLTWSDI